MDLGDALFLGAAGFAGGIANAIAGGGALIVFPALVATGHSPLAANVTKSVAQWPGYLGGVAGYRRDYEGQRGRIGVLSVACAAGSAIGCALVLLTPSAAFEWAAPFLVLLASLLLAGQSHIARWVGPPDPTGPDNLRVLVPLMFGVGLYGGYFGGAIGVMFIGLLTLVVHDTLRRLNAVKGALQLVVGTVGMVAFGLFGPVQWGAVAVVAPLSLIGGYAGAWLAARVREQLLRWGIVVFGVAVAVLLFAQKL